MYTEIEQQTLDIDWFFTDKENIGFVASGGGRLPQSVSNSKLNQELLSSYFRNLPVTSEISVNLELDKLLSQKIDERYLRDFIMMSKKGLYSFDKTKLNNFSDQNYHLVTKPVNPLKFDDLPMEIKKILKNTRLNNDIKESLNIDTSLF